MSGLNELLGGRRRAPGTWAMVGAILSAVILSPSAGAAINVKDHGAVGDGVADDTAAIQSLIDSAPHGSTILFPAGRYRVTGLSIGQGVAYGDPVITLEGEGWRAKCAGYFANPCYGAPAEVVGSVLFVCADADDAIPIDCMSSDTPGLAFPDLTNNPGATGSTGNLTIKDLAIVGPGLGKTAGVRLGAGNAHTTHTVLDHVFVGNFLYGLRVSKAFSLSVTNVRISGTITAVRIDSSNGNRFENLNVWNSQAGVELRDSSGNVFDTGIIENLTGDAFVITDSNHSQITGFHFETIKGDSIVVRCGNPSACAQNNHNYIANNVVFVGTSQTTSPIKVLAGRSNVLLNNYVYAADESAAAIVKPPAAKTLLVGNTFGKIEMDPATGLSIDFQQANWYAKFNGLKLGPPGGPAIGGLSEYNLRGTTVLTNGELAKYVVLNTGEPDAKYFVTATASATTSTNVGATRVRVENKSASGFEIRLEADPGAGKSVTVDWVLMR